MASLRSEVFLFSLRSVQKQIFQIATLYKIMSNPTDKKCNRRGEGAKVFCDARRHSLMIFFFNLIKHSYFK